MLDYNLIDRISAIKLELEYETNNIYSILIAIRNILHQSDGMTYLQIKNVLVQYFNLYPHVSVNYNLICLITNPFIANNNSMISILLNSFNENNTNSTSSSSEVESLDSIDDNSQEDLLPIDNQPYPMSTNVIFDNYLNNMFYGPPNNQLNNNFEPNISNSVNSILTLSNFTGHGIRNYGTNNNNILNLFTQLFNTMPLSSNYQDIPIVMTDDSFNELKKCKYIDLNEDIKINNKKCMITLDEFNDNDDVLVLPCNHVFKINEITNWLKDNSYKCPICRNPCGSYYAKIS